jgi:dsRNA-specific ribonuclease
MKKKNLPPDNENMHSVTLLTLMRPRTEYINLGSVGKAPHVVHSVKITVDEENFLSEGPSLKEARKRAACKALIKLFNWKQS